MMDNQNLLDKTTRDKMSLTAELESIRENVAANVYGKVFQSDQIKEYMLFIIILRDKLVWG